ncbi:MAG TPA: hypothetical protein VH541_03500 [Gaiellaceae bacterium]|jgi:hypothetical protein
MSEIVERLALIEPDWTDVERRSLRLHKQGLARRVVLTVGVLVATAALAAGAYAAATDWLTGSPAPPSVRADFGSYTPQLGFHPDPGNAVLVAQEGNDQLYATTNAEGSYCIVASTPWKRPQTSPDGGTCIPKRWSDEPIVAGFVAGSATAQVLAGRISVKGATSVRLSLPDGSMRTVPLGTSGFFLTSVGGKPCQSKEWSPQIEALARDGTAVAASTIALEEEVASHGKRVGFACWLAGLHS